ncbi:MAG: cardiolipin synthase B, partial [Actinomycetota bacterium]
ELDEEVNLVALDPGLVRILDDQFEEDLERSVRIDPERWDDRSVGQRALEKVVAPLRDHI